MLISMCCFANEGGFNNKNSCPSDTFVIFYYRSQSASFRELFGSSISFMGDHKTIYCSCFRPATMIRKVWSVLCSNLQVT